MLHSSTQWWTLKKGDYPRLMFSLEQAAKLLPGEGRKLFSLASSCSLDWQHWLHLQGIASVRKNDCQHSLSLEMLPQFELITWLHSGLGAVSTFHQSHQCFLAACILFKINLSIKSYDFWFLASLPSEAWLGYNAIATCWSFVKNIHQGNNPFLGILSPLGKPCSYNFEWKQLSFF